MVLALIMVRMSHYLTNFHEDRWLIIYKIRRRQSLGFIF